LITAGITFTNFEKTIELLKNELEKIKKHIKQDKGFELLKDDETVGELKIREVINEKLYE
jgi:predicted acetyltransferase